MNPSSTRGVASSASFGEVPPIATANKSFMFLMFDVLIWSSTEWRCAV